MQEFDHPNVLKLTGVCMNGGPSTYLVMPFMMNGSLLTYLKKQRDMLVISQDNSDEDSVLNFTTNIIIIIIIIIIALQCTNGL